MKKRIECSVSGRVQLVMYRDFACRKARDLGVFGYVENKSDGTVVVVGESEEDVLHEFIEKLKEGSMLSRVDQVLIVWKEPTGEFTEFTLRY